MNKEKLTRKRKKRPTQYNGYTIHSVGVKLPGVKDPKCITAYGSRLFGSEKSLQHVIDMVRSMQGIDDVSSTKSTDDNSHSYMLQKLREEAKCISFENICSHPSLIPSMYKQKFPHMKFRLGNMLMLAVDEEAGIVCVHPVYLQGNLNNSKFKFDTTMDSREFYDSLYILTDDMRYHPITGKTREWFGEYLSSSNKDRILEILDDHDGYFGAQVNRSFDAMFERTMSNAPTALYNLKYNLQDFNQKKED